MKQESDRLPPYSPEAEQGVLGCVLLSPVECLTACIEKFRHGADVFYDLRHKTIYTQLLALHEKGVGIDLITLQAAMASVGTLEQIGGIAYLNALQDCVPSAANLPHYLDIVLDKRLRRKLLQISAWAAQQSYEGETGEKAVLAAEEELSKLTEDSGHATAEKSLREVTKAVIEDMEEHRFIRGKTQLRGLPTGRNGVYLDKLLRGIRDTYYMVLAGRPGDGKTAKALNIIEYLALDYVWHEPTGNKLLNHETQEEYPETVARKGIPIAIFSIEMDSTSLGYRMLFGRAGVDTALFTQGFPEAGDDVKLIKCAGEMSEGKVWVDDTPGQSIGQIAAKARRMKEQYGIKLFVLDYLQLVELEGGSGMDRVKELTKVSRKIMALKKQLGVPWLVLAQMNRNIETTESKRAPVLSDLKDCGAIESDADVVLFLHKPEIKRRKKEDDTPTDEEVIASATVGWDWSKVPKRVDVRVAKNRYGPVGHAQEVFCPNLQRFEDFHLWKKDHGVEGLKQGEREAQLGNPRPYQPGIIDDDDIP